MRVRVSGFIATLSATDKAYREHFYDDMANEAREVLATRALYLAGLSQGRGDLGDAA